jgi:hypothetical protein
MFVAAVEASDGRASEPGTAGAAGVVPDASRSVRAGSGSVSTGFRQTPGTFAICRRNTFTLIVPGWSVAK